MPYLVNLDRVNLLKVLPKQSCVAEIGVAEGVFSEKILNITQPYRFYLIDPWEQQVDSEYIYDVNNVKQDIQENRYQLVKNRFDNEINRGQIVIKRSYSYDAAYDIENKSLDWIYLDGNHSYESIMMDLNIYKKKIKDEGIILGHDYTNNEIAAKQNFGVVKAVNKFVKESEFEFWFLNKDPFPTYVLAKSYSTTVKNILATLLYNSFIVAEIKGLENLDSYLSKIYSINNQRISIPYFEFS